MSTTQPIPGSSSSPNLPVPQPSPALRNVLHVFAAHFHVRKGNQLLFLHPSDPQQASASSSSSTVASDLEWKAIPNGSHAISHDWLLFEVSTPSSSSSSSSKGMTDRVGLAVFRKRDLDRQAREGQEQRGARLVSVGAIVSNPSRTSSSWRSSTLPHLHSLSHMAEVLALQDPMAETASEEMQEMLKAYHQSTRFDPACQDYSLPPAPGIKHLPVSNYDADPLWRLPIMADALGPLLPTLLKRCLIPGYRLLLFSPTGGETEHAAVLAMNLGEIAQASSTGVGPIQGSGSDEAEAQQQRRREPHTSSSTPDTMDSALKPWMWIRGLVGLHDMGTLEDEARVRRGRDNNTTNTCPGWIAWTTDKLYLEKPKLFDAVVDLSPLVRGERARRQDSGGRGGQGSASAWESSEGGTSQRLDAELPILLSSSIDGKGKLVLIRQQASAREFATFRNLDQQATVDAHRVRRSRRRNASQVGSRGVGRRTGESESTSTVGPPSRNGYSLSTSSSSSSNRDRSSVVRTALTLLRYWLASWWILPHRWRLNLQRSRSSFGYVPLSIRSDGGVRGSLMLLDEISGSSSEEEDEEEEEEEEEEETPEELGQDVSGAHKTSSKVGDAPEALDGEDDEEGAIGEEQEEVDPILLATGAIGNSLRRRRASRGEDGAPRLGFESDDDDATPGSYPTSAPASSSRKSRGGQAGSDRPLLRRSSSMPHHPPGSHARLADALFDVWSAWLMDLRQDVEEMLYRFCPASNLEGEGEGDDIDRTNPSNTIGSSDEALKLKAKDLAWAGLSAFNDVDTSLVRNMAAGYTDREVVVEKGWGWTRWLY